MKQKINGDLIFSIILAVAVITLFIILVYTTSEQILSGINQDVLNNKLLNVTDYNTCLKICIDHKSADILTQNENIEKYCYKEWCGWLEHCN